VDDDLTGRENLANHPFGRTLPPKPSGQNLRSRWPHGAAGRCRARAGIPR
jgi:hypothetical protein